MGFRTPDIFAQLPKKLFLYTSATMMSSGPATLLTLLVLHLLDIRARGKVLLTARQHDRPDGIIRISLFEFGIKLIEQWRRQRIERLGSVEGKDGYLVGRGPRGKDERFNRRRHEAKGGEGDDLGS